MGRLVHSRETETKREKLVEGGGITKKVQGGRGELEQETRNEGAKRWGK